MLTSKERAALRSMANTLQPVMQIGKGGVGENLLKQLDAVLDARELVKITVLETAELDCKETAEMLCRELRAEPVQTMGRKITLFRRNHEEPKIKF